MKYTKVPKNLRKLFQKRGKTIDEAMADAEKWRQKNPKLMAKLSKVDFTELVRKMRDSRWSSPKK